MEELIVSNAVITSYGANNNAEAAEVEKMAAELARLQESLAVEKAARAAHEERLSDLRSSAQLQGVQALLSKMELEHKNNADNASSPPSIRRLRRRLLAARPGLLRRLGAALWRPGSNSPIHLAVAAATTARCSAYWTWRAGRTLGP